jgi:RecJ-like exonuclease
MNAQVAKLALTSRPLRFGDANQVAALKHLHDLEAAKAAIGTCEHLTCRMCHGSGEARRGVICDFCGGDGREIACICFAGLDAEAIIEARKVLNDDNGIL